MKALKGLFLCIMVFLFFIVLVILQIDFVITHTALSGSYFSKRFDQNKLETFITDAIIDKIKKYDLRSGYDEHGRPLSKQQQAQMPDISGLVLRNLDQDWLKAFLATMVKGFVGYIVADQKQLPKLEIKPLKTMIVNGLVEAMLKRGDVKREMADFVQKFDRVIKANKINTENDEISVAAVDQIMRSKEIKQLGLGRETATEMLRLIGASGSAGDKDDLNRKLMGAVLTHQMRLDAMKDSVDLNIFMAMLYKDRENPLAYLHTLMAAGKGIALRTFLLLILCFVLIIVIVGFKPASYLKWLAGGLIAGGLGGMALGALGSFLPQISGLPDKIVSDPKIGQQLGGDLTILHQWLASYLGGCFRLFIAYGVLLSALGAGCLILNHILLKHKRAPVAFSMEAAATRELLRSVPPSWVMPARILGALILIAAIPLTAFWGVKDFTKAVNTFNASMKASAQNKPTQTEIIAAFSAATGASFFSGGD